MVHCNLRCSLMPANSYFSTMLLFAVYLLVHWLVSPYMHRETQKLANRFEPHSQNLLFQAWSTMAIIFLTLMVYLTSFHTEWAKFDMVTRLREEHITGGGLWLLIWGAGLHGYFLEDPAYAYMRPYFECWQTMGGDVSAEHPEGKPKTPFFWPPPHIIMLFDVQQPTFPE